MSTLEGFVDRLWRERASAIVRAGSRSTAADAMEAAVRGGFRVVEFTLTTPGALDLIEQFAARDDLVVGAGTVMAPEQARAAVERGARFLVSPVIDPEVVWMATELGVAMVPGTHTPTEMWTAHRAGAPFQKVFPAGAGGPTFVRSILGPMPFLRLVPTNGVDQHNAAEYLRAGAFAVGFTTALFDPAEIAVGDVSGVEPRARTLLGAVRAVERPETP